MHGAPRRSLRSLANVVFPDPVLPTTEIRRTPPRYGALATLGLLEKERTMFATKFFSPLTVALLIATACGGSAAPAASSGPPTAAGTTAASPSAGTKPTDSFGGSSVKLADGSLSALPTLPLYINVLDVPQQPNAPLQHAHIAGFVYALNGVHRLAIQGGDTKDLSPGAAAFTPQDAVHTHSNPGTTANEWYFVALRNTNARTAAPTF